MTDPELKVGSTVRFLNGYAILKYVGPIKDKSGVFAGVELMGALRKKGKNSGDAYGVHYFDTSEPLTGLFIPYKALLKLNKGSRVKSFNGHLSLNSENTISSNSSALASPLHSSSSFSSSPLPNSPNNEQLQQLEAKNKECNLKIKQYETKLEERSQILKEMESTISNFEPILADYDKQLKSKEERYSKFKKNAESQIKELLETIELLESQTKESQEMYAKKFKELQAKAKSKPVGEDAKDETSALKKEIDELQKQLQSKDDAFKDLKASKDKEINSMRKFEMKNYTLELKIEDKDQEIKELQNQISKRSKQPNSSTETSQKLEAELKSLKQKLGQAENDKDVLQASEDYLKKQIENVEKGKRELLEKYKKSADRIKEVEDKLKEKDSKLEELEKKLDEKDQRLEELKKKIDEKDQILKEKEDKLKEKDDKLKEKDNKLQEKDDKLKEKDDKLKKKDDNLKENNRVSNDIHEETQLLTDKGELKVYEPETKADPAAGRTKWCGLCERPGHDSIDCPYDNGLF